MSDVGFRLLGISNLYSHEAIGRYIYMYRCGTYAGNPLYNGINTKGYMTYIITLTPPLKLMVDEQH